MTQQPIAFSCYRHSQVPTWIRCQRCGRPICPACMIPAAVGFQCPECVAQGKRETRQNEGPFGGERSKNPAVTTIALISVNVIVWLLILLNGNTFADLLDLTPLGRCSVFGDPTRYAPGQLPQVCAALSGMEWTPGVATGAFWQILTSAFSHQEVMHIGFNMVALWFLGPQLERIFGRTRFLAVYLISAVAGSALTMWFSDPESSSLGASGAVFGLIGALLMLAWRLHGDVRTVLIWLGANLVFTFVVANISWQGHIGGLLGGIAATAIIIFAPKPKRKLYQVLGLAGLVVVVIAAIAIRVILLG